MSEFFSSEGARRVIDQTIRGERRTDPATGADRGRRSAATWAFLRVTGPGSAALGWPAKILFPLTPSTFEEDEVATIFPAVTGEQPGGQGPYIARLSGWDDTNGRSTWQALFHDVCCSGGGPGGGGTCESHCGQSTDCMAVDFIDPDGMLDTVYLPSGGIPLGGVGCYWGTGTGTLTVAGSRYLIGGIVSGPNGGAGTLLGASLSFYEPGVGGFLGRIICSVGYTVCADYLYGGDFPMGPITASGSGCGKATILRVYPAPGRCGSSVGTGGTTGGTTSTSTGSGAFCQPCNPATDNPCFNCGDGSFCANSDGCFGSGGGALMPMKAGGGCSCSGSECACASGAITETDVTNLITETAATTLAVNASDVGNVGVGEDDLFVDTIAANTLLAVDWSIQQTVTFLVKAGVSPTARIYFGGIKIYDSGGFSVSGSDTAYVVLVTITRASATTARATAMPSAGGGTAATYTSEATLTGLDFTAAITLKSTGQGGSNDDIKAVQSVTQTLPAPGGATVSLTVQDRASAATNSVPTDPGGYAGGSASLFYTGPTDGLANAFLTLSNSGEVTDGNVVRVFKDYNGVKKLVWSYKLNRVPADPNTVWQMNVQVPMIRLNGDTDAIYVSQDGGDPLIITAEIDLFQAA